jgi:hypothetical protein
VTNLYRTRWLNVINISPARQVLYDLLKGYERSASEGSRQNQNSFLRIPADQSFNSLPGSKIE